jgi:Protein of unknown function (DUF1553)/Protein of unknown function (DUF1549)/Concanavalin A-like lectin/glucanases superfamily/Planctomycete cytochrome C
MKKDTESVRALGLRDTPLFMVALLLLPTVATAAPVDFNRDIAPILSDRCFHCHGPDTTKTKGDLRLDIEEKAKEFVISPGDPEDSELITRIFSDDPEERMPPQDSGKQPLTREEAELFKRWIVEGAKWGKHWAWVTPVRHAPPEASPSEQVVNEIDQFILTRLKADGHTLSPEASRETLIRRASLDITGLPPTLKEIDSFLKDKSPNAYEKVLDRLFASKRYGERMAIEWLDGARYADSNGFQNDFSRAMWPWRDWVVNAFNENMPYDEFAVEQIAGDLLPNATDEQRMATGLNRNNRANTEGGSIEAEWQVENIVDRTETLGTVFLGLTIGCARCHDHKYDPITQKDFYRFFAFSNNTEDRGFYEETRGNTGPLVEMPTAEQQERIAEFDTLLREKSAARDTEKTALSTKYEHWEDQVREYSATLPGPAAHAPLNDAVAIDTALEWADGLLGAAPRFTGNAESFVDLGTPVAFSLEEPFTLSVWVYREKGGALFSTFDPALKNRGLDLRLLDNGTVRFNLAHEMNDNAIRINTEARLPKDAWSHVAVTYAGDPSFKGIQLYINGVPALATAEINKLEGTFATDRPLRLGGRADGEFFTGRLADAQVFDEALSPEQIDGLFWSTLNRRVPMELSDDTRGQLASLKDRRIGSELESEQAAVSKAEQRRREYVQKNVPTVMVMKERTEMRPTYRLNRGLYDAPDKSEQLTPAIPTFLPPLPDGAPQNRLGLARWLVSPENPLTARVTANRLWQQYFGVGLVKTSENFGTQGEFPSHPELLDWLATELIRLDWDLKAFQKMLVMSATYRQAASASDELLAYDPENRLLARGPRFRLQAELIRDNALAISGLLSDTMGGPPVKPYQPDGMWSELAGGAGQGAYMPGKGDDLYRRSLYTYRKRTVPHATLSTFDAPSFEICRVQRARTNTPLQALALLNDVTYVESARHLAQRMLDEGGRRDKKRIAYGFRLATGRYPTAREAALLTKGLASYLERFENNPETARAFIQNGESPVPDDAKPAQLAAYTAMANAILNLDETITRE